MLNTLGLAALLAGSGLQATMPQGTPAVPPATDRVPAEPKGEGEPEDVVVVGERLPGSAIGDIPPLLTLDPDTIRDFGAFSIRQLLDKLGPITKSATGEDPVILLNGRRVPGLNTLSDFPPEALRGLEVLSEQDAVRFGYPPTARVINLMPRKKFRGKNAVLGITTTTEGGATERSVDLSLSALDGDRRSLVGLVFSHQDPLLQSQRPIRPDPSPLFAIGGNVAASDGGSLDPALDALAGRPVSVAAVPLDPADRATLAGYVPGAGTPRPGDIGRYRTLVSGGDTLTFTGSTAGPAFGSTQFQVALRGSVQRRRGLDGLMPVTSLVPASNPFLPFDRDVALYRYLPEVQLGNRAESSSLSTSAALQGRLGHWAWDGSLRYDRNASTSQTRQGIPLDTLDAAIAAGGDPFAPVSADVLAQRLVQRSRYRTDAASVSGAINGEILRVPAGSLELAVRAGADASRSSVRGVGSAAGTVAPDVTRRGANVNASVSLPIASRARTALAALGDLSASGSIGISLPSGQRRLVSTNLSGRWSPRPRLALTASAARQQSAPDPVLLSAPTVEQVNVPYFDFATGENTLVTLISGANPALLLERRRSIDLGLSYTFGAARDVSAGINYFENRSDNPIVAVGGTGLIEAVFPERLERDGAGRLIRVDTRPLNLFGARQRGLRVTTNFSKIFGMKGLAPGMTAPPGSGAAGTAATRARVKALVDNADRLSVFVSASATMRLEDSITLRSGLPPVDLLNGESLAGIGGGRTRWDAQLTSSLSCGGLTLAAVVNASAPSRVRSDNLAADLRTSGLLATSLGVVLNVEHFLKRPWTRSLGVTVNVNNLLNRRLETRDGNGRTPVYLQPYYLDPAGRTVGLSVRKLL